MRYAIGAKHTPIYDRLAKQGAFFRGVSGFESADWFERPNNVIEMEASPDTAMASSPVQLTPSSAGHSDVANRHHTADTVLKHLQLNW